MTESMPKASTRHCPLRVSSHSDDRLNGHPREGEYLRRDALRSLFCLCGELSIPASAAAHRGREDDLRGVDGEPVAGQWVVVHAVVAPDRHVSPVEPAPVFAFGSLDRRQVGSIPFGEELITFDHAAEKLSHTLIVRIGPGSASSTAVSTRRARSTASQTASTAGPVTSARKRETMREQIAAVPRLSLPKGPRPTPAADRSLAAARPELWTSGIRGAIGNSRPWESTHEPLGRKRRPGGTIAIRRRIESHHPTSEERE